MTDVSQWLNPPAELRLEAHEIHVWRTTDDDASAGYEALLPLLSSEETARANGFKFERDRARFVFCRAVLRDLLGRYTGEPPKEIAFTYGPFGKPSLQLDRSVESPSCVHFNISHTNGMALFAFSASSPVGIDVEAVDQTKNWQLTARRFFHPGEWASLEAQSSSTRTRAGYNLWTCKEACLKATGDGIGGGLGKFEVMLPLKPDGRVDIELPKDAIAKRISLHSLDVGNDFAAAVAGLGPTIQIRTWNWQSRLTAIPG